MLISAYIGVIDIKRVHRIFKKVYSPLAFMDKTPQISRADMGSISTEPKLVH